MKEISTTELIPGSIAEYDYYYDRGDLLFTRGTTITARHLQLLTRRNIFDVYIKESDGFAEIKTLSNQLDEIDKLEYDELIPRPDNTVLEALRPTAISDIPSGRNGFYKLLSSSMVKKIDIRIEQIADDIRPLGQPLKERMSQKTVFERSTQYKSSVTKSYDSALVDVRTLFAHIGNLSNTDALEAKRIVEGFMNTFVTDHNILLNISGLKNDSNDYIYNHSLNVCLLTLNIAAAAGYSKKQILEIGLCALLHDIGMLLVPKEIRTKKGRLREDEIFEVHKHPILGLHLLDKIKQLPESVSIVAYQSHERINGKGYPRQRKGQVIHPYAKILQCADIFEAVSSPRSYRGAMAPYKGMEMLIKMARQGFVSSDLVKFFLTVTSLFPVGSIVELNDNRVGKVIDANPQHIAKPMLSILIDENGKRLMDDEIYQVNLSNAKHDHIQVVKSHHFDFLDGNGIMEGF